MVSASYGQFASDLRFSDDLEPAISETMIALTVARQMARWSVRVSAGAIVGGELAHGGRTHDVGTGWLVSLSGARQWTFGARERWFATAAVMAGFSSTTTREDMAGVQGESIDLRAGDFRVGALFGATLADRISPYVLARYFAGPVLWQLDGQDVTGTDQYHYQIGLGSSVRLPFDMNALVDASLLGERSLSIGMGMAL